MPAKKTTTAKSKPKAKVAKKPVAKKTRASSRANSKEKAKQIILSNLEAGKVYRIQVEEDSVKKVEEKPQEKEKKKRSSVPAPFFLWYKQFHAQNPYVPVRSLPEIWRGMYDAEKEPWIKKREELVAAQK